MHDKLSRRRMLSLLGASMTLTALPATGESASQRWDLIVVGGGNAGLPAAIFAAQRGPRILIVDSASQLGGTLWISTGQMSAAGTLLQASMGIEDSPQSHFDDIIRISKGTANPEIARLAVFNAADTFNWLMDNGLEVGDDHPITGTTHEPYSHARYAWGKDGGLSILKILEAQLAPYLASGQIAVLTSTEVTGLLQTDAGEVTGVVTRSAEGQILQHRAKQVLLTTGGYASNADLFAELEGARDYADVSYPHSQGAGITLARAAGGYVRGGEHHLPLFGAVLAHEEYPAPMIASVRPWPPKRPPWEIYVNVHGKRFLREDIPSHDAHEQALLQQPQERCWIVFDQAIMDAAPPLVGGFGGRWSREQLRAAFDNAKPMFFHSDSLDGLARATGVDSAGLSATVADYNRAQSQGGDSFGRQFLPAPIARPPFYAIQLQSWLLTTFAGVAVDGHLRVIRPDGGPIPNLYAAGELLGAGQFMGRSYCGGMLVTPALTFGRLLGQRLLRFA